MPKGVSRYVGENWYLSRRDSVGEIDAVLSTVLAIGVCATRSDSVVGVF